MIKQFAMGLLGLGVVVLFLSFLWPSFFSPKDALSPEQYDRLEELDNKVVELHLQMESFKRKSGQEVSAEMQEGFDRIVAERDSLKEQLEGNILRPNKTAVTLRYLAIVILVVGVATNIAVKAS